jgi:hypothetical protein
MELATRRRVLRLFGVRLERKFVGTISVIRAIGALVQIVVATALVSIHQYWGILLYFTALLLLWAAYEGAHERARRSPPLD